MSMRLSRGSHSTALGLGGPDRLAHLRITAHRCAAPRRQHPPTCCPAQPCPALPSPAQPRTAPYSPTQGPAPACAHLLAARRRGAWLGQPLLLCRRLCSLALSLLNLQSGNRCGQAATLFTCVCWLACTRSARLPRPIPNPPAPVPLLLLHRAAQHHS